MYIREDLIISDSLYRLLETRQRDSICVKLIFRALEDIRCGGKSTLLAEKLPGNYFSFREKEGMISFMPRGKNQIINVDGTWNRKDRQSMKPSRWIKLMLNPRLARKLKDHLYAEFTAIVKHEEIKTAILFEEISVKDAYNSANFNAGIDSCMWDDPVSRFYDAFECMAVVAKTHGGRKYVGRAILWPYVEVKGEEERVIFMDRIYCPQAATEVVLAFKEHAVARGWWYKYAQNNSPSQGFMLPNGELRNATIRATTDENIDHLSYFPYLDTLRYGGPGWLSNVDKEHHYEYKDAHGRRIKPHYGEVQTFDGIWVERSICVEVDGAWYPQGDNRLVTCTRSGELMNVANSVLVDISEGGEPVRLHRRFVTREQDRIAERVRLERLASFEGNTFTTGPLRPRRSGVF